VGADQPTVFARKLTNPTEDNMSYRSHYYDREPYSGYDVCPNCNRGRCRCDEDERDDEPEPEPVPVPPMPRSPERDERDRRLDAEIALLEGEVDPTSRNTREKLASVRRLIQAIRGDRETHLRVEWTRKHLGVR
jgi:hypothetical protein